MYVNVLNGIYQLISFTTLIPYILLISYGVFRGKYAEMPWCGCKFYCVLDKFTYVPYHWSSENKCLQILSVEPENWGPSLPTGDVPLIFKNGRNKFPITLRDIRWFRALYRVTEVKLMGSMHIRVGIWFFSMDLKGEVTGSRGGTAITMTHIEATSMSKLSTSLALRIARDIREHKGLKKLLRERNWK